jgi:hypothetical protein
MLNKKPKRDFYNSHKIVPSDDLWTYRTVVTTLSLTVIGCIVGTIWLQICGKPTPELLTALGTGAIGALAGIFAPPPSRR